MTDNKGKKIKEGRSYDVFCGIICIALIFLYAYKIVICVLNYKGSLNSYSGIDNWTTWTTLWLPIITNVITCVFLCFVASALTYIIELLVTRKNGNCDDTTTIDKAIRCDDSLTQETSADTKESDL